MRRTFLAILVLFLLGPVALEAQRVPSPFQFIEESHSLGGYVGYVLTNPGDPEVGPRSAPIFGVRYNLRLTGPLSGEAGLSFFPTDRQVIALQAPPGAVEVEPLPTGETAPMNMLLAEVGLRFHITGQRTWRGIAPYVVGTGGLAADLSGRGAADADIPEDEQFRFGPGLAVGIGVGTDWFLTQRLSLRLELRDHILRVPIPRGFTGTTQQQNQWTNNFGFSVGTALHF